MTADERIEKLLNRFGQTISDLPKPQTADYAYGKSHIAKAYEAATEWHGRINSGSLDTGDFICHLADVIDRMEAALETATFCFSCSRCEYLSRPDYCGLHCEPRISDLRLSGMTGFEFDKFIEGEEQPNA